MSKRLKRLFLLAVMFLLVSASDQPENKSGKPPEKKITVAVYPFKVTGIDKALEPVLTSIMISKLSQSKVLNVIEDTMIGEVLKKQGFANSDLCDNSQCQIAIGKLTPAQKIIAPEISRIGKQNILTARVIDIQTGVVDFPIEEQKSLEKDEELVQLVEAASISLRQKFGEKVDLPQSSSQPLLSPASPSSQSSSGASLDSQNILGLVVENAPGIQGDGVIVNSVLPDSPCMDVIKPGVYIIFIKPNGPIGATEKVNLYETKDLNGFRRQVAQIKPAATVGIMFDSGLRTGPHRVKCVIPSQPQTAPQTPAPTPPEKKAKE